MESEDDSKEKEEYDTESSCVSIKSDNSMPIPIDFSDGAATSHPRYSKITCMHLTNTFTQNNLQCIQATQKVILYVIVLRLMPNFSVSSSP